MSLEREEEGWWTASRTHEPLLSILPKRFVGVWFEMWQLEMGNHYKAISNLFGWRTARKTHVWCHVSDSFNCLRCKKGKESDQWQPGSWNHPFRVPCLVLTVQFQAETGWTGSASVCVCVHHCSRSSFWKLPCVPEDAQPNRLWWLHSYQGRSKFSCNGENMAL